MSAVTVIVLCPHGRRQTVKASQNTSILEVLEEACRKQGINPEDYDISHYSKLLDLSLSIRFANLPNNALLELIPTKRTRQEGSVTVCLQLESGERLTGDFPPSASMLDIINKCSSQYQVPQNEMLEPVCIYMRQQFTGDDIKKVTLRSLGLTGGKAAIRLMYRQPEALNQQAHVSSSLPKQSSIKEQTSEPLTRKLSFTPPDNLYSKQPRLDIRSVSDEQNKDAEEQLAKTNNDYKMSMDKDREDSFEQRSFGEPMQVESDSCVVDNPVNTNVSDSVFKTKVDSQNNSEIMEIENHDENPELVKEIGEIKYLGPRNAILFNLEDITEVRKADLPDDFFELTVDDIRYLMNEYKREREEIENEPLMLKSQREARLMHQLYCYKQTVIRIYFPDKLVLQGTFIADETVQTVWEFVRNFLEDKELSFYLYTTPPKTKLSWEKTLFQERLVPAAIIYFGCDTHRDCYLDPLVRTQISDPRAATLDAAECRKKKILSEPTNSIIFESTANKPVENVESKSDSSINVLNLQRYEPPDSDGKTPKWFKFGKK